jgi:D-xylose transport system substrate-binding protein
MQRGIKGYGLAAVAAAALVAGCGDDNGGSSGGGGGGGGGDKGGKIAFLLPESKTARYETQDKPRFEKKVKELCASCEILYSNADQDASKQQQQAEAAITQGANVLVLDPVDSESAAGIVERAKQSDIPVISYDRLILNADVDYYVEFDSPAVGKSQAEGLIKGMGGGDGKSIVMINGAPTDNNAKLFKEGAHSGFEDGGVKIAKEYDTPDWSPDKAQQEMDQAITSLGKDSIDGVYAANDGTAGGAIAAMKGAGLDPAKVPVTGQDAELAAIQRVLAGEQYLTVYKAIQPLVDAAAPMAVALAQGKDVPSDLTNGTEDNGKKDVPTMKIDTTVVTKDNVKDTIVADGYWPTADICTAEYKAACAKAGIS